MIARWTCHVLALCCALLLVAVPAATAHPGAHRSLRVMTFNIHAGAGADGRFDLARTAAAINAEHPDVVGLEEVDRHWSRRSDFRDEPAELAARTGMHVFFAPIYSLPPTRPGAPRREFGVAVLSRGPILAARNRDITRLSSQDPSPSPAPAPGFAQALIGGAGPPTWFYVTHLDYRPDPSVRRMQVRDMTRVMRAHDGILVGDFNTDPDAPELDGLRGMLHPTGEDATYPAEAPERRLDQVWVPRGEQAVRARVPDTLASDHRPAVVDVARDR